MSYYTEKRNRLIARKAKIIEQIEAADDTLIALLATENEEYRFDDGAGSQRVKRRNPEQIRKTIENLEIELTSVCQKLEGLGVVNIRLRRKKYNTGVGY